MSALLGEWARWPNVRRFAFLVGKSPQEGFSVCAYSNLDADDTWDVWVVDQKGEVENLSNDLE